MVFPRLSRRFLNGMIEHCGKLGPAARDALRSIVGFPVLTDLVDRYGASIALFAACATGDVGLAKLLLQHADVELFL